VNSSRQKICLVSCLFSTGALQAQFIPVESTGLPYHIIVSQVFIDSAVAPAGTQIGIFDSILCVGADTVEYAGQENIDIVTWEGSVNPYLPGFAAGDTISAQLFANIYGTELTMAADLSIQTGNGTFGYGSYTVAALYSTSGLAPDITAITEGVTLGPVQIGSSDTAQVTFANQGNVPLSVYSVAADTDLFAVSDYSGELAEGDTMALNVIFSPADTGQIAGHITIASNDPDQPALIIPVSAQALPPTPVCTQPLPDIALVEDSGPDTSLVALNDHFTDSYNSTLAFFAFSSDTSALETMTLGAEALVVEPQSDWFGAADIYVGATNGSFTVYDTVQVTVAGVNDAPGSFALETIDTVYIDLDNIDTDSLALAWDTAMDIEDDPVTYLFTAQLRAPAGGAVLLDMEMATTLSPARVAYSQMAELTAAQDLVSAELQWNVAAYDGQDSTLSSNGPAVLVVDIQGILGTEDGVLPAAYALQQNYPNPFNPATVIRFSVAAKQAASLQIFDITGRLVATIINEPFAPGEHEVTWQAGHLPSGTYFMQMKSGDFVKTRKMVLLK